MTESDSEQDRPTLRRLFLDALERVNRGRPASAYLLLAILAVTGLSTHVVHILDSPHRMALWLTLNLVFFFVVFVRAVFDCGEILRDYVVNRERAFRETLGDEEFVERMHQHVAHGDWPISR
ncbi:MAG: hypothetical protein R6W89_10875 [Candidatus Hydrogenedentota bacterium]